MDDEIDFGDILPAPGGAANDHDDVLGAPEYHADPPSEERDPGGDDTRRDGAAPKRVLVKIARRVGDDRAAHRPGIGTTAVPGKEDGQGRGAQGSEGQEPLSATLIGQQKARGAAKGRERPRDDGPTSKEKRQKMERANAFCLICGAIGLHYTEGCPTGRTRSVASA